MHPIGPHLDPGDRSSMMTRLSGSHLARASPIERFPPLPIKGFITIREALNPLTFLIYASVFQLLEIDPEQWRTPQLFGSKTRGATVI